jgi:Domain of unknown function (DUF4296)
MKINVKKSGWIVLLIGWWAIGCDNAPKPPDGTLSEEKMAVILADVHVAEARVTRMNLVSLDSAALVTEHLKMQIFKANKVDSVAYNRSYQFYARYPEYLERIYEIVLKDLDKRQKKKNTKGL